jgi:hypothetical protein
MLDRAISRRDLQRCLEKAQRSGRAHLRCLPKAVAEDLVDWLQAHRYLCEISYQASKGFHITILPPAETGTSVKLMPAAPRNASHRTKWHHRNRQRKLTGLAPWGELRASPASTEDDQGCKMTGYGEDQDHDPRRIQCGDGSAGVAACDSDCRRGQESLVGV